MKQILFLIMWFLIGSIDFIAMFYIRNFYHYAWFYFPCILILAAIAIIAFIVFVCYVYFIFID